MERPTTSRQSGPSRVRTAAQAVAAAGLLVAMVVVPLVALIRLIGSPQTVPTVWALALLATWTLLMLGLGVEIAEASAARRGRSTTVGGVGGPLRTLARWLVGSLIAGWGVLGLGGAAAATTVPRSTPPELPAGEAGAHATAGEQHSGVAGQPQETPGPERSGDHTPSARRATRRTGSPDTQARPSSPATESPPGPSSAPVQEPGVPSPSAVRVEPGDNFWELAEQQLIEAWGREPTDSEVARYWMDYIEANRHRLLPPGDPDLIHPGQVFTAPPTPLTQGPGRQPPASPPPRPPDDGEGGGPGRAGSGQAPTEAPPTEAPPTEAPPTEAPPVEAGGGTEGQGELNQDPVSDEGVTGANQDPEANENQGGGGPAAGEEQAPDEEPAGSTAPGGDSQPGSPTAPEPAASAEPAGSMAGISDDDARSSNDQPSRVPLLAAGGLILGGVLLWLQRKRNGQQRLRQTGEVPVLPSPEQQATEEAVVEGAHEDAVLRVGAALQAAAAGSGSQGLPRLEWVETSPQATMLVLQEPWGSSAPPGFRPLDGTTWLTTAPTEDLEVLGQAMAAPACTMVPIGATGEHSEALIELESSGVVMVQGPETVAHDLLRALAVAAATSPWSESSRVILAGLGGDLTDLPWVTQAGFDAALDVAEAHLAHTGEALRAAGCTTTAQARAASSNRDSWDPVVVVSVTRPERPDQIRRLQALAEQPHQGVAVVTLAPADTGDGPRPLAGRWLVLQPDESLAVDGIDEVVWPRLLDEASADGLVRLLRQAEMNDANAYEVRSARQRSTSEEPADGPLRLGVDELLRDVEVLVRLLGDVEAVQHPGLATEQKLIPPRHKALELLAYLASRQEPVSTDELRQKLFASDDNGAQALSRAVGAARSLVGDELLRAQPDGAYLVAPSVATDYGLFAELTTQAEETEDAHRAAWLLTEALDLVKGEPFGGLGRRYAWVGPHRGGLIAEVVDAAEELAEVRLALGDWRSADWAARQGLQVAPNDERLYRLLMRASVAAGNGPPAVRQLFEELCDAIRRTEQVRQPEDVLSPETVQLFHDLAGDQGELAISAR